MTDKGKNTLGRTGPIHPQEDSIGAVTNYFETLKENVCFRSGREMKIVLLLGRSSPLCVYL